MEGLVGVSGIDFPLYAFVKRTRTSQKISKISGRMVRTKYKVVLNKAGDRYFPSPTVESNLSGRFEPPKKKDPAAINRFFVLRRVKPPTEIAFDSGARKISIPGLIQHNLEFGSHHPSADFADF